jgi:Spy/CpxP family protein refolding chaperone
MKQAFRTALVGACLLLCAGTLAHAQRGTGGGGGGRPGGGGMPGGGMGGDRQGSGFPGSMGSPMSGGRDSVRPPNSGSIRDGNGSIMRGRLQLAPPGRWWDDNTFVKSIGLRRDQQKKMDAIFNANKSAILENYRSLQREEYRLEALTRETQPDKARIFAEIDAVNMARAAVEKAYAQMQLQVRQEMDNDQLAKMDKFRDPPSAE